MPTARLVARMIDRSGEKSTVTIPTDIQEALDTFNVVEVDTAALVGNLEAVSACEIDEVNFIQMTDDTHAAAPTDPLARREGGLRIYIQGNSSGEIRFFTVPGPDYAVLDLQPNTDLFDLTDEPLATFVTWIEANYKLGYGAGTESVTVLKAVDVGRNN